jgi:hypothetical protein
MSMNVTKIQTSFLKFLIWATFFPAGHVIASIVFFGILTYLAWQRWNSLKVRASILKE